MGDNKGLSATYLVAVTYSPSWTIPSDYRSGYYFAVTVVDRYGNEYAIRTTRDNPLEPVSRPVLDNPKEGERISADFTLQWHSEETTIPPVWRLTVVSILRRKFLLLFFRR